MKVSELYHVKGIEIKFIPHNDQRYETVGDYWLDKSGIMQIRASAMGDIRYSWLVVIHEIVEIILCLWRGIPEPKIKAFDERFEVARAEGNEDEPGDDLKAPYQNEHCVATGVERLMCALLGVKWKHYEKECNSLCQQPK
jgi:hypothetical protein